MIKYSYHPRFERQFKKLLKRFRTLEDDLEIAKVAAIELFHLHEVDNQSVEVVPRFNKEKIRICKIKKFACKSLRGKGVRSGIRVIYAFMPEISEILFLEIYYKEKDDTDMDYDFAKEIIEGNL